MNTERWDGIGRRWIDGDLSPANGLAEWKVIAQDEAHRIANIIGPGHAHERSLLEVGCGVGRLTPWLAQWFASVVAIDTSPVMLGITAAAAVYRENVQVMAAGREPPCDVALVWGNLYDEDWTDEAAGDHLDGLLAKHHLVLVQTTSIWLIGYCVERTVQHGDDWLLLHA